MNIVTPAPAAFDKLQAAETAAWDDYEAALAVIQGVQDALAVAQGVLQAYKAVQWRRNDACNALDAALTAAHADYERECAAFKPQD